MLGWGVGVGSGGRKCVQYESTARNNAGLPLALSFPPGCSNTGSIRDEFYSTSRENSSELVKLSSIN
jgi:hypothetical protein